MLVRPVGPRIIAYGVAVILVVLTVAVGMALPPQIRAQFTIFELLTLAGLLLATLIGLYAVARSFVRIDDEGLWVRNGYRDHIFHWADLQGVSFRAGSPWPTLVTTEGDRVILFAIQSTDGDSAHAAVAAIREHV